MIAGVGLAAGVVMLLYMKPVNEHLKHRIDKHPLHHLLHTVSKPSYLFGFATMSMLATGGFMLMPFGSAFGTHNLGLTMQQLPMLYLITGVFSIAIGPLAGKLSDKIGKYKMFLLGSALAAVVVAIYTNLGITPFWLASAVSVLLFMGITARMIPASALMTAIPALEDRGAYMSVNSAAMQISGGIASVIAGMIVSQSPTGMIEHYDTLGYVVIVLMGVMAAMLYKINKSVGHKLNAPPMPPSTMLVDEAAGAPEFVSEMI